MATHFCNVECARKEHKHGKKGIPLAAILMDHPHASGNKRKGSRVRAALNFKYTSEGNISENQRNNKEQQNRGRHLF